MDLIKSFLKDVSDGKFRVGNKKFNESVKQDERYEIFYKWLRNKYIKEGRGFKSIIKDYDLNVGFSFLRRFGVFLGFKLHSNKEANFFLKKRRSENARKDFLNKTGFFKNGVQEGIHHKSVKRGIQGYYWNVSKNKYVWLRSSWEFIYAKWLNKQKNIVWDVEIRQYKLSDNTSYRPDFFIYDEEGELKKIVETKGYWKDKLYKVELLRKEYKLPIVVIDNIKPYCENNLNREIKLWKQLRKLELNE